MTDSELLNLYAETESESAFSELVTRHLNLVYSAARRQVGGNHQLAQDVAQSVFCDLARKAKELAGHQVLSGWLFTSTRFAASRIIRSEQRRVAREQEAYFMQETSTSPADQVSEINPRQLETLLDEAMHDLKEPERDAILLRFFERRQFSDVGEMLGISADAARMRVERALERLRNILGKRGLAATSASLAAVLAQQGVTAAPVGLISTITAGAVTGSATTIAAVIAGQAITPGAVAAGETILTTLKIIGMTKLQMGAAALLIAGAGVPLVWQHQTSEELRAQNRVLAQQNEEFSAKITPLAADNSRLSNLLSQITQGSAPEHSNEIHRLRAELTRLRAEAADPARVGLGAKAGANDPLDATLQTLGARVTSLKQRLEQMPHTQIPELQYLSDKHWLDAVAGLPKLENDEDYRQALNMLRAQAKSEAGGRLQAAVQKFADANGGMLPENLTQVQPFLEKPLDPAIFERYQMVATGKLADLRKEQSVFEEVAPPVDNEYDTFIRFHKNGRSTTSYSQIGFMIESATEAYAQANGGKLPREATQVAAYLQQPVEPGRVQKFLSQIPSNVTTLAEMKARKN